MTFALTGATGQLGRLVTDMLLEHVDPSEVVAITRRPEELTSLSDKGLTVRRADFADASTLPGAFEGVDQLLLISTDTVGVRLAQQVTAVKAAAEAGIKHVVYTSLPEPSADNPAGVVADHAGTEEALRDSGVRWTMLRNNLYADMQVATLQQAASSGRLVTNVGDGLAAYVTRADCAAVAVGALLTAGDEDRTLDVTGPSAVSAADLASLASTLSGSPVEVVQLDDSAYRQGLVEAGLPDPLAELMTSFGTAIREGYLAKVSDVVDVVGGRRPTSLGDLLRLV